MLNHLSLPYRIQKLFLPQIQILFYQKRFQILHTYGPLLGLYGIGILSKIQIRDKAVPFIAIFSAVSSYFLAAYLSLGFEILAINGAITAVGLFVFKKKKKDTSSKELD